MPIRVFLRTPHNFDEDAIRVMGIAFECARSAVRDHAFDEVIAGKIIELAQAGERDIDKLCNASVKGLTAAGRMGVALGNVRGLFALVAAASRALPGYLGDDGSCSLRKPIEVDRGRRGQLVQAPPSSL
jgi:hypothetical protein